MPILDQSFSTENFEIIYNILSRKGKVNMDRMPKAYKDIVADITGINERLKELNHKKKSTWTDDETTEHQSLKNKRKELRIKKHEELLKILSSLADKVNSNAFRFDLNKNIYDGHEEFVVDSPNRAAYYAMCQLQHNMKRTFNIEMQPRHSIMVSIKRLLNTKMPFYAIRSDVSDFFESIPQEDLLAKIESNSLLSYKSKSFIRAILKEYNEKKDTSKVDTEHGVPRGVGISSMLSEIYMQDIDRELKSRLEVIFYVRYVDDIFMVMSSLGKHVNIVDYYDDIKSFFACKGLILKNIDDKKCKILDYVNGGKDNDSFYYLGYNINLDYHENRIKADFCLSEKKKRKLKTRIDNAFTHFDNLSRKNLKQARRDLLDALRLISGNVRLMNSKNGIKAGLYYSNDLLDDGGLKELDTFTQSIQDMPLKVSERTISDSEKRSDFVRKMKERIAKIDLKQSWKNKTMYNIHMDRLSEIMKWLDYEKKEDKASV